MAIVSVKQTFDERWNSSSDKRGVLATSEYTLSYLVVVDGLEDSIADAAQAGGVPQVNDEDGDFRVKSQDANRDPENPYHIKVSCTFSDSQDQQTGTNKLNADISIDPTETEEPKFFDRDNKKVCNTVGRVFSNQPTDTIYDEAVTVSFQSTKVDQTNIDSCRGRINTDVIKLNIRGYKRTFAVGTLLFKPPKLSNKLAAGNYIWDNVYTLLYREDGWGRKIIHVGRQEKKTDGTIGPIYLKNGQQACEDQPLDKNGKAVPEDTDPFALAKPIADAAAGEPCYSTFNFKKQAAFKGLLSGL